MIFSIGMNGILKEEFLLYQCKNIDELKKFVDESIYIYNEIRPHLRKASRINPLAFEKRQPISGRDMGRKLVKYSCFYCAFDLF